MNLRTALDRVNARLLDRRAFDAARGPATGELSDLDRYKTCLLITYRRDGTPVPTPVWFATEASVVYVMVAGDSGKLRRLQADNRVRLVPCTTRGRPVGPSVDARARTLDEAQPAERALGRKYGAGRRLVEGVFRADERVYLEISL